MKITAEKTIIRALIHTGWTDARPDNLGRGFAVTCPVTGYGKVLPIYNKADLARYLAEKEEI